MTNNNKQEISGEKQPVPKPSHGNPIKNLTNKTFSVGFIFW